MKKKTLQKPNLFLLGTAATFRKVTYLHVYIPKVKANTKGTVEDKD